MKQKIIDSIEANRTDKLEQYSVTEETITVCCVRCKFSGKVRNEMEKYIVHDDEIPYIIKRIKSEMKKCEDDI